MVQYPKYGGAVCGILILFSISIYGQTQSYKQGINEVQFNHDLNANWALEFNVGQSWTSKPGNQSLFSSLSQVDGSLGVHYMPDPQWKISYNYGFYFNKYVPEIDQRAAPEWRSTIQAVYFMHRERSSISTRLQIEDRHIFNPESVFEAVERFRLQLKITYPFNGKTISRNVCYGIASEEVIFKTHSKISGSGFFDRNKFVAGLGYAPTDNLQLEMTYINEFLPRDISNNYNELQITVIFKNVLPRLNKYLFGRKNN